MIKKAMAAAAKSVAIIIVTFCACTSTVAQVYYSDYFQEQTLWLDYTITGHSATITATPCDFRIYDGWAGPYDNIGLRTSDSDMEIVLTDDATGRTIYRDTYSSLFCEWQTMGYDAQSENYNECVRMPLPKAQSTISLIRNYNAGKRDTILNTTYRPNETNVTHPSRQYEVANLHTARHKRHIDIVFLPEGYTASEMDQFLKTAREMAAQLFEYKPFDKHKKYFEIKAILAPSPESGIDIPSKKIDKNTLMDFSYDTFGISRYIGTRNYHAVSQLASNTIWNHAIILVNSDRYGGGGIYNFYSVFPGRDPQILELFVHEFGHAFANLADEYAEPDNPIAPNEESGRRCIMHDLDTKYYCNECKSKVKEVIRHGLGIRK